jgi:hypothetical protein
MVIDKRVFNARVNQAIIEHFRNLFGPTTVKIINFYLKQYNTALEKICDEPARVSKALHATFEEGANVLESEIIKAAYATFGLKPNKSKDLETALEKLKHSVGES